MRIERHLDQLAERAIAAALDLPQPAPALLRPTADPSHGDYQLNAALPLAKRLGQPPQQLAARIAAALAETPELERADVAGPGFVNLTLSPRFIGETLAANLADAALGVEPVAQPETIVVDYSSPNIAKQMHVGHLRSTIIGDSLVRLLRANGHRVIGDNHLGDWGTQFGLLIVGMREWGDEAALASDAIGELERVYKLASARAKQDEAFAAAARAELAKLQSGDPENRALWESFVAATRETLSRIYDRLGVQFDHWLGESAYDALLPGVVELLLARGVARESEGAICVFLNELDPKQIDGARGEIPKQLKKRKEPFIVRKRDGAYLYSTTDIATVIYRRDELAAQRSVYVVDSRQSDHFQQLFAVAGLLGLELRLDHVGFGMILGEDGTPLKTRDGKAVTLASLLDEAEARARERIDQARAEGTLRIADEQLDEAARVIGIGAVKYTDLMQNRASDYKFDFDKMISFKGNAAPYIQYSYARVRSIFDRGEVGWDGFSASISPEHPAELALARVLLRFPDVIFKAADQYLPHLVCDHVYELATAFSRFFTECPVLRSEGAVRESRLGLTALTGRQIERGLSLLGIGVLERM